MTVGHLGWNKMIWLAEARRAKTDIVQDVSRMPETTCKLVAIPINYGQGVIYIDINDGADSKKKWITISLFCAS